MKKKVNALKIMRVILALLFFIPFLFIFIDFTGKTNALAKLAHFQVIPALVGGMFGILAILLLLSFIFGRVYCSTLCPFGVLQDILERITTFRMKKTKRTNRYSYSKPKNKLRYILLAVAVAAFIAGWAQLLLLFDPYSNFGRIAFNLFAPVYTGINNLIQMVLLHFNSYALYYRGIYVVWASFAFVLATLLAIGAAVFFRGRVFCNTLCPAGAILSLVSRCSIFKINVDKTLCNSCGLCEKNCKAQCIDSKSKSVDASRCVGCFNCLSSCAKGGVKYQLTNPVGALKRNKKAATQEDTGKSRREFIATSATIAGSLPLMALKAENVEANVPDRSIPILPPGAKSLRHFSQHCTACHLCVAKCPTHVLKPAVLQYGLGFVLKPHLVYDHGFCNPKCTVCIEVCPNHAITPITLEEKMLVQVGIAELILDRCIVYTENTDCGACSEHCPSQAVHMVPYKGSLTIPKLTAELCIGCGGCEYICPVQPIRAINIIASKEQGTATPPYIGEKVEIQVDDFGF